MLTFTVTRANIKRMNPGTTFATPVTETTPGAAYAPELAGIETATELAGIEAATAAAEYSEYMALQAQNLGMLLMMRVRAEGHVGLSEKLDSLVFGTLAATEVATAYYHPAVIAAQAAADQERALKSLDSDDDDGSDDKWRHQ